MEFRKAMGKNAILSMILCSVTSFLLLYADNLKVWESEEYKKSGCVEKLYYKESGKLGTEIPYKNGKKEGVARGYEDGNLMLETPYEHDNTEGVGKQYDKSGNLKIETPFKNAKKEGTEKVYYPSGDLGIEIQHTNNKINGIVKLYNKEKSLSGKQPHEMENLLAENALVVKPLQTHTLKD